MGWLPASPTFMGAKAHRTAAQTISNVTSTTLLWTAEEYDTDAIHDTSTNTGRFTVPTGSGGKWRFAVNIVWAVNATGFRNLFMVKNGTARIGEVSQMGVTEASLTTAQSLTVDVLLSAGDYVEAVVYQTSGGNLDISVAVFNPWMSAQRIG